MADERRIVISSAEHGLSAEEIARRTFATAFRGFDAPEVRSFLKRVADAYTSLETEVRELRQRLDEAGRAPSTAAGPAAPAAPAAPIELDEEMLTNALGAETARVLRSAREAAADIQAKAEHKVARLVKEAEEEAARLRSDAETVLSRRAEEAEEVAAGIRRAAEADAEAARAKARSGAEAEIEAAKAQGRELVIEAQALREKVLGDLSRRRKLGLAQVEQLRAGRERLLEAYRAVRRTLDEVTEELGAAETEARLAAEAAGRRVAAEADVSVEDLEAELAAGRDLAFAPAPAPAEDAAVTEAGEPEVEPEVAAAAEPDPEPEVEPAPVVALEERRSSTLRIIRRPKGGAREEPVELAVVEPSAADEAVRVIRPEAGTEPEPVTVDEPATTSTPEEPAPAEAVVAAAHDLAEAATEPDIDSLFARIKADRAAAVADAEEVLAEAEREPEPEEPTAAEPAATSDDDESALQLRDKLLEPVDAALVRRLKRALQDDQNDTLDRLRTTKGKPTVEVLLVDEADHAHRFRDVAVLLLAEAAKAGAAFAGRDDTDAPGVGDQADELAMEIVHPLRERLARGLEEAAASGDDDLFARVSSVYREWKLQRLEPAARHAIATVFARNAFALTPRGAMLRWVVDDEGGPCPDCDDDALAGPTPRGEAFPTGQLHPPAHPGCRCVLVAAPG